jgi:hypothetical protein
MPVRKGRGLGIKRDGTSGEAYECEPVVEWIDVRPLISQDPRHMLVSWTVWQDPMLHRQLNPSFEGMTPFGPVLTVEVDLVLSGRRGGCACPARVARSLDGKRAAPPGIFEALLQPLELRVVIQNAQESSFLHSRSVPDS